MSVFDRYIFPKNLNEAKLIQNQLSPQVIIQDQLPTIQNVVGVDVAFKKQGKLTQAAVVVLQFPSLELIESAIAITPTHFPYISGYLSFREIPAILEALSVLNHKPDLIFCDGQGISHPRRFGIASHLGVILDCATIGVAKSLLIGKYQTISTEKGNWTELEDKNEIIGAVLRSKSHVKPLYISIGHKISLKTAIDWVLRCTTQYRLPETTRLADKLSRV